MDTTQNELCSTKAYLTNILVQNKKGNVAGTINK